MKEQCVEVFLSSETWKNITITILLTGIEGIFNGSTNYILTKVFEEKKSYEVALQQRKRWDLPNRIRVWTSKGLIQNLNW